MSWHQLEVLILELWECTAPTQILSISPQGRWEIVKGYLASWSIHARSCWDMLFAFLFNGPDGLLLFLHPTLIMTPFHVPSGPLLCHCQMPRKYFLAPEQEISHRTLQSVFLVTSGRPFFCSHSTVGTLWFCFKTFLVTLPDQPPRDDAEKI